MEEENNPADDAEYNAAYPPDMTEQKKEVNIANPKIGKGKILIGCLILFVGLFIVIGGAIGMGIAVMIVGSSVITYGKFQNWFHWE